MPATEAMAAYTGPTSSTSVAAVQGLDPVFAPEEEYMPAPEALAATVASLQPPPAPAIGTGAALSDDQVAALVSRLSRDIIEKIAWEVVPDLAERIITEEIRKIKEGV